MCFGLRPFWRCLKFKDPPHSPQPGPDRLRSGSARLAIGFKRVPEIWNAWAYGDQGLRLSTQPKLARTHQLRFSKLVRPSNLPATALSVAPSLAP